MSKLLHNLDRFTAVLTGQESVLINFVYIALQSDYHERFTTKHLLSESNSGNVRSGSDPLRNDVRWNG